MLERLRNSHIWVRLMLAIAVLMIVAGTILVTWNANQQKQLALAQSHDFASSVNQMTMAALVFMKTTKTMKKRHVYLDQVKQSSGVSDLRIVRSEAVNYQFGDGDEDEMRIGPDEKAAMDSGKPFLQVRQSAEHGTVLKAVFPHYNKKNYLGKDCQECHDEAPPDALLGAVTMEIPLNNAQEMVASSRNKLIAGTLIAVGFVILAIYFLVLRLVTRPLAEITNRLRDIAEGEGDLTQRLPVRSKDEIGQTAGYFNQMMEKLQDVMRRVAASSDHLSSSASELQASTEEIRHAMSDQSEKSSATAAAVEQMAASIMSVAQFGSDVLSMAMGTLEKAQEGNQNVSQLTERLNDVEQAVGRIKTSIEEFITQTGAITKLTREVKEIADQTNLLALTAAIEAARAGEHGRGFAVVADEVRKLAEKSTRSATEIDVVTRNLNSGSDDVRQSIDTGLQVLQTIRDAMGSVAAALASSMQSAEGASEGMHNIKSATDEQLQATSSASSSVEAIAALSHETSASVDEVARAASDLERLAANLQEEIHRFRI